MHEPSAPDHVLLQPTSDLAVEEGAIVERLQRALAPGHHLVRKLGKGGMGSVYLAREPALRRMVAVKVLSPDLARDEEARARFEREGQAVAGISHPNVVAVYSVGEMEDGLPYLVMQYVEGPSLADRLATEGPLDIPVARRIVAEVASALAAAHRNKVIHRDIKPANVLWDDSSGRALVTDFGIAALLDRGPELPPHGTPPGSAAFVNTKLTQAGMSLGTPAYMSPEQLLAEPVSEKTDVYSVGLLGYELLTGAGPYDVATPQQLVAAHLTAEPKPLVSPRGDVDPELEQVLRSCLAKAPADRPAAAEVSDRLVHGAGVLLEWPPPGMETLGARTRSATRALSLGAVLVVLPLIMMTAFEPDSIVRVALPPAGVLLLLATGGAFVSMAGWYRLYRAFGVARAASLAGYGWLTIAEVACDTRGDTGAIIAGGREYATLAPAQRDQLRRQRLVAGALRLSGAVAPIVGFMGGIAVALRVGAGPALVIWTSLLLPATLLFVAKVGDWQEAWQVRATRRRRTRRARELQDPSVAAGWTGAFEVVRAGQPLGAGSGGIRRPVVAIAVLAIASSVLLTALVYVLTSSGILAEATMGWTRADYSTARNTLLKLSRLERYRLPVDSGVTPLRAGQALHAIARFGAPARDPFTLPARDIAGVPPSLPYVPDARIGAMMRAAARGLSAADRRWLEERAAHPALAEFRLLARAPTLDLYGAAIPADRMDRVLHWQIPWPYSRALVDAAIGNLAAAMLAAADGRRGEAELRIRETLSAGFLLLREANATIAGHEGLSLVDKAREALVPFFESVGRAEDARFASREADPIPFQETSTGVFAANARRNYERALGIMADSADLRSVRLEMLMHSVAYAPCGDPRQVIFGVDQYHHEMIDRAARTLVRFPSDSVLLANARDALNRPFPIESRLIRGASRFVDGLLGARRVESCVSLALFGR